MRDFLTIGKESGTDKCTHHGYHYFYPRFLEHLRDDTFNMLEIGYHEGGSARMWAEYFPNCSVYAMDISKEGNYVDHIVIKGDQSRLEDLESVVRTIGSAKFIIDDGSHHPVHQIETFEYLFNNLLEDGGVYIIEDIETSYWRSDSEVYGYRIGFFNSLKYTNNYIDNINSEFSGKENNLKISSITYGQNCIIINKQTMEESEYFRRGYRFKSYL